MGNMNKKIIASLVRIWRNWNPYTVLLEMQNVANFIENSMEFPQKIRTAV